MGKKELDALLNLSSWCLIIVEWLFFAVPWGCLRFVVVVFPDHTNLLFWFWLVALRSSQRYGYVRTVILPNHTCHLG